MDDPRWLRLIAIGLVLAAVAVGYFLFTGRLSSKKVTLKPSPSPSVLGQNVQTPAPTPVPFVVVTPSPIPSGTQVLPNTGFPAGMAVVFSVSALAAGWGLRKFPK